MAWIEMARDATHGGSGWGFGECLWSPTRTQDGRRWAYWSALLDVAPGDVIVHLRGRQPDAQFIGYSTADAPGYETSSRPPDPGDWSWAQHFFRVPLREFTPFATSIRLDQVFSANGPELIAYHAHHTPLNSPNGRILFYVQQSGRLQCQNGAYLSQLDEELGNILLDTTAPTIKSNAIVPDALTAQQLALVSVRIGQQEFSDNVKRNWGNQCCFPHCPVADRAFLIGSHIARWADAPQLRGSMANGLCLCLLHDRAFERGLFTLTTDHRIAINPERIASSSWATANVLAAGGQQIRLAPILPLPAALELHWDRIKFRPK